MSISKRLKAENQKLIDRFMDRFEIGSTVYYRPTQTADWRTGIVRAFISDRDEPGVCFVGVAGIHSIKPEFVNYEIGRRDHREFIPDRAIPRAVDDIDF